MVTENLYSQAKNLVNSVNSKVKTKGSITMKIAFDLDGVVLHQEMYSLKAIDSCKNEQERSELMR